MILDPTSRLQSSDKLIKSFINSYFWISLKKIKRMKRNSDLGLPLF